MFETIGELPSAGPLGHPRSRVRTKGRKPIICTSFGRLSARLALMAGEVIKAAELKMTDMSRRNESDLASWYWLTSVRGLGPTYIRTLVETFGSPKRVFETSRGELEEAIKLPARTLSALEQSRESLPRFEGIADYQSRTAHALGARILTLDSPDYPPLLRSMVKQAPPILHVQGDLGLIRPRAVAVVGTRSPTIEAIERVGVLSKGICESGSPVVSGMARGIDTAAHRGALESSGITVGILGSGLDRVYPPENASLYEATRQRGLLISQFRFGSAPSAGNLLQRNKLIVALSEAVVVAESNLKGGAMNAARSALEQGKNLFALRWPDMRMPTRAGTLRLLEANLARPMDTNDLNPLFDNPTFMGAGAAVNRAWDAAFPRSRGKRKSRRAPRLRDGKQSKSPRRRNPDT